MKNFLYILIFFGLTAKGQVTSGVFHGAYYSFAGTPPPIDTFEAQTNQFFDSLTANSVPFTTSEKKKVDTILRDIKGFLNPVYATSNIFSKVKVLLPIFGATAYSHSLNLIDASTYRATMVGSPTHSAAGIDFNGTTQYLNTNFNSNLLTLYNRNVSIYADNKMSSDAYLWGVFDGSGSMFGLRGTNTTAEIMGFMNVSIASNPIGDFTSINIESSGRGDLYSNGVSIYNTTPGVGVINQDITVAVLNLGSFFGYKQFTCKIFIISESLTPTEQTNLYNAILAYQTRLGRP